jgi:hypothetical protein
MSLAKYEAMIQSGIFTNRDRLVLIEGYLVEELRSDESRPPRFCLDGNVLSFLECGGLPPLSERKQAPALQKCHSPVSAHNLQHFQMRRHLGATIDALISLLKVSFGRAVDVEKLLRVAVNQREPGTLDLDHDLVA